MLINKKLTNAIQLHQSGQLQLAKNQYQEILMLNPLHGEAIHFLGVIAYQEGDLLEALVFLDRALELNPGNWAIHGNRGLVYQKQAQLALALSEFERALFLKPDYPEALNNRALVLQSLNLLVDALASVSQAIELRPLYAEAWNNYANILKDLGRIDEAFKGYDQAINIAPNSVDAIYNRGKLFQETGRYSLALDDFKRALILDPSTPYLLGSYLHIKMFLCDWDGLLEDQQKLIGKISHGERVATPFSVLSLTDQASIQMSASLIWTKDQYFSENYNSIVCKSTRKSKKIRIGYFSADFRAHALTLLMAGVFEHHDREKFEVFAFSFGKIPSKDHMRKRIEQGVDAFFEVENLSNSQLVQYISQLGGLDIAVDLGGYTAGSRAEIFAMRIAPVQVNYLGFPATMGASFMDYIIADPIAISPDKERFYTEKIVYLPHTFQANDDQRPDLGEKLPHSEFGLASNSFVFCCMNNSYKITPIIFTAWMYILKHVQDSVLWLYIDSEAAKINLVRECSERGVDSSRLIFSPRLPYKEHLRRLQRADLFLDTYPFNGGTTTSDALWSGLPVITRMGETFASRMGASLLATVGLSELVAATLGEYKSIAIDLAKNAAKLNDYRDVLKKERFKSTLFNTTLFTCDLERAYEIMHDRAIQGMSASQLIVPNLK